MDRKTIEEDLTKKGVKEENLKVVVDYILDTFHETEKDNKKLKEQNQTLETEKKNLKIQLTERDKDLEELKKVDVNELKSKITELETKNKELKESSEQELINTKKDFAIDSALKDAKVRNVKSIRGLLDMEKITYKDGKLEGLDEQINSYKKSDSYLFDIQEKGKTIDLGGEHKQNTDNEPKSLAEALHQKYDK